MTSARSHFDPEAEVQSVNGIVREGPEGDRQVSDAKRGKPPSGYLGAQLAIPT
jgi:hypothetical protein